MYYRSALSRAFAATVAAGVFTTIALAQPPAGGVGGRGRGPTVNSPEVTSDGHVTFRILAPKAEKVTLSAGDINVLFSGGGAGAITGTNISTVMPASPYPQGWPEFTKNDSGIWEATIGPLPPGAYRYVFMVDGVRTLDPVNTHTAESNTNMWSMFTVSGAEMMDTADVPHGAVAEIFYYSSVLKTTRRMHIYTPPGYESANTKYPVFYLLHGAGDTDDAWTSVGRASFIFDNLLAAKKIKPMIVVMPAGHQPGIAFGAPPATPPSTTRTVNPFTNEFITDMLPYVEKHYRTINDRQHRAIAGLSMGGSQTLDIAFTHLAMFSEIGVFSSGASLGGGRGRGNAAPATSAAPGGPGSPAAAPAMPSGPAPTAQQPPRPDWEATHLADLDNASLKKGTKLIWLSTGKDDGLIASSKSTVELLKKHGFEPVFIESPGAHSWFNWRNYLIEFTPQLFQ